MSIITMPSNLMCEGFSIGQRRFDIMEMSDATGHTAARMMGPPRWTLSISAPQVGLSLAQASVWEAMLLQLRGSVNHLAAWDIVRTAPRGTMRETMSLYQSHSAGASVIAIQSNSLNTGKTLLAGDWLQIGSGLTGQLVKVVEDITADSNGSALTTKIEPPLRKTFAGNTAITWDKPLGHYRMSSPAPAWNYIPGSNAIAGFALDFTEQWS